MDSVLGAANAARDSAVDARAGREAPRAESAPAGRNAGATPRRSARSERDAEADEAAAGETRAESPPPQAVGVGASARGTEEEALEAPEAGSEGELLAAVPAPGWEAAAVAAPPAFEALGRGDPSLPSEGVEAVVEAPAEVDAGAEGVFEGLSREVAVPEDAGLAAAPREGTVVADPRTRAAFLAALEQAGGSVETTPEAAGTPEAAPPSAAASALAERTDPRGLAPQARPTTPGEGAARGAVEPEALRPANAGLAFSRSPGDSGSHDPSRGREQAATEPAARSGERAGAEPNPIAAAAIEGATAGLVESAPSAPEPSAAARVELALPPAPSRAPETNPAMQPGRALPSAAPDAIAVQADWLATRGGGTARLVLNPPELGEIAIRVTVRQQSVEVVMVAQTALAQSMAEEQGDRLSQAFASKDLRLEQFEVRRGDPSDASGSGQSGSSDAGARERERAQAERESGRGDFAARGGRRDGATAEAVVPPSRIGANGRAMGVDLRI